MKENYQKPLSKLLLVPLARVGHMLMPLAILCKGGRRGESESHSVLFDFRDPVDYTVHGILQARILEWVAFPFSGGSSQIQGLNPEIEPRAPALQADSSPAEAQGKPRGQERVESNYLSEVSEHQNQFRAQELYF